jgi:hypothetical protein
MPDEFPMGDEFFELVAAGEEGCEKVTGQSADGLGEMAPQSRSLGSYYRAESYLAALNKLAGATGVASGGPL